MKIAFVTLFDATDVRNWSGTELHMWKALEAQGFQIELIGNLRHGRSISRKLRKLWGTRIERRRFLHLWDVDTARDYASDVAQTLQKTNADVVVSPSPIPLAFLDCPQPKVMWTDATFCALCTAYEEFDCARLSSPAVWSARAIDAGVARNCDLLLYASEWGARKAVQETAASPEKVTVVPFGANLDVAHSASDVAGWATMKDGGPIGLLFIGVDWVRKGAAKAITVTENLRERGFDAHLTIVGCHPPDGEELPAYVHTPGFISKHTQEGRAELDLLYRESHFLIVPTIAEAYGVVFAESSAFGLPSLSHRIGGVPTIVRDDVNGRLFDLDEPVTRWADWVVDTLKRPGRLTDLAISSFNEYETRLNWSIASRTVASLIIERLDCAAKTDGNELGKTGKAKAGIGSESA